MQPRGAGTPAELALLERVYEELRTMARRRTEREGPGHTLQATALVHEVYLRLARSHRGGADGAGGAADATCDPLLDRAPFFRAAAAAMRRILIEHARARQRGKRSAGGRRVPLANVLDLAEAPEPGQVEMLEEAISRLERESPAAAQVVRQRFYGGLTIEETAEALGMSPRTVTRKWTFARAWLFREVEGHV